jgi:uncharacterized protein
MEKTINPFLLKGYAGKEYFCNRERELSILIENIQNGIDTTLISPRRMGKTGLILRLIDQLQTQKEIETLYVDIYASQDLSQMIKLISEAMLRKFPEKSSVGRRFLTFLKSFRPTISYDPLSGEPQVSILYQTAEEREYTLRGLFEFLDDQKKTVLLAIDEFQQINEYPEKNVEALLRSYIQHLKNVRFIYCGSKRSMMIDMFSNAKKPFYSTSNFLFLEEIDENKYGQFIKETFAKYGRIINEDALKLTLRWTMLHTYYTQILCNRLFSANKEIIDIELFKETGLSLLKSHEQVFFQYRDLLTSAQWNYLIAIANEGKISKITSQDFLAKHKIGTPANSRRLCDALTKKELIMKVSGPKGASYRIYDVFFMHWLKMEFGTK